MNEIPDITPIDTRAIAWSARSDELADRPLLVLMHGYGSDETDLFGLSPYLPLEPVIASLRAPVREGPGFAWFGRDDGAPGHASLSSADAACRGVLAWLDTLPTPQPVGLMGFSQGAAMVLHLMRHAPERFAYGVQLSGFVVEGSVHGDDELLRRRPPVFWGRGTDDAVVDTAAIERTSEWMPRHTTLDARIYEGLAHAVSQQELTDIAAYLQPHLH